MSGAWNVHWIALQPTPEAGTVAHDSADPLADAHTALAWWGLRFTPLVARVDDALVLETSASERLFGGRAALLDALRQGLPLPVQMAQGSSSLIALGRLWSQAGEQLPDALPLRALAAAQPHLTTLAHMGVRRWGQLRALPRGGLARRFGAGLLNALDQAYGQRAEVYPWVTLPEVFDMPLELAASVESAPALLFGARRLLAQLRVWLRARQRGVLAFELTWELDARRANARHVDTHHDGGQHGRLELRTATATQDMQHLQRLLAEQLERVTLPAPVLYLRLRSLQTEALSGESRSLLLEDQRKGDALQPTLERLVARLGAAQVQSVQPNACHVPERMQCWQPWSAQPRAAQAPWVDCAALYPSSLLTTPLPLQLQHNRPCYHGVLELQSGPQRVEGDWLEGAAVLRDYFVARSAQAGLLWIYRERLPQGAPPRWFLHGWFA